MAGPVGLSMGALPLHWQPGDFHFGGGGLGGSFQTTFPYNSHCLPLQRSLVPRSREPKFNDVYVWGTSQDLASPSLVETLCFCDCRPSSSIKGALNAFLPLACSTFIFPPRTARGNSKKKKNTPAELLWAGTNLFFLQIHHPILDVDVLPDCTFLIQRAKTHWRSQKCDYLFSMSPVGLT